MRLFRAFSRASLGLSPIDFPWRNPHSGHLARFVHGGDMAAVLLSALVSVGMMALVQPEPLPLQEEEGEPNPPGVMLPEVQDPAPPVGSEAPQDAHRSQDDEVELATETPATPEPTPPPSGPQPQPPHGVGPPAWRGVAWGSAVALAIAVPGALLGFGVGVLFSLPTLVMAGVTSLALFPLLLVAMLVSAIGTGCCWGAAAFALFGAIPGGLVAGVSTMLGAAKASKRKMPWVPTLLATTIPRAVGGVVGLGAGLATLWFGTLLLSVGSQVLSARVRQPLVGTLVFFWAAYAALMLTLPGMMLLGTMLGDLLGVWLITNVINPRLSRDSPPSEDSIPTALFFERNPLEPLD